MRLHTKRITFVALMSCVGIILGYVENLIPLFRTFPGIKIGISNIVIIYVMFKTDIKNALFVGLTKSVATGALFSGVMSMLYSITGIILSVVTMAVLKKVLKGNISLFGISIAGSAAFNVGQILMCCMLLSSNAPLYYLGILLVCSVINGFFTGGITKLLLDRGI